MIRVEPDELLGVAGMLRSVAAETATIGSELAGCVRCSMPAEVGELVRQIVATADSILDQAALVVSTAADDLVRRAAVAGSAATSDFHTWGIPAGAGFSPAAQTHWTTWGLPAGASLAPAPASEPHWSTWGLPAGATSASVPTPQTIADWRFFGLPAGADPATFRLAPGPVFPTVPGGPLSHNQLTYASLGTSMNAPLYTQFNNTMAAIHVATSPLSPPGARYESP